jgi:hypothetical protein
LHCNPSKWTTNLLIWAFITFFFWPSQYHLISATKLFKTFNVNYIFILLIAIIYLLYIIIIFFVNLKKP